MYQINKLVFTLQTGKLRVGFLSLEELLLDSEHCFDTFNLITYKNFMPFIFHKAYILANGDKLIYTRVSV